MCKYCENGKDFGDDGSLVISKYQNNHFLVCSINGDDYETKIEFCPKCGKKLEEEVNS